MLSHRYAWVCITVTATEASRGRPALSSFWAAAAACGAVWGTLEVTVGSFLHALRLPFTGAALAAMGAVLLVAQRQVMPARGLSLATGLVAAACKMLSPGGVILGPMVGIVVEALLVEAALLLRPRSSIGALLSGVLAVSWALGQKLVGQYVLYGGDIFALYLELLRRAGSWLRLDARAGWTAASVLVVLVVVLGGAGGLFGRRVGSRCRLLLQGQGGRP